MAGLYRIWFLLILGQSCFSQKEIVIHNESEINSEFAEFSPCKWNNNFLFVAKQKQKKQAYYDLKFTVVNASGEMIRPAYLPEEINSILHEGPASYDHETNTLYFTRSHLIGEKKIYDDERKVQLQIYYTQYILGEWAKPKKLEIDQSLGSYCHPSISDNGNILVFASDQSSEDSKMDLYITYKENDVWLTPQLLPASINSNKNDWFPYLHSSGYLVYASSGITADEGMDMFVTKLDNGVFSEPMLLPYPLNSNFDDFGIYIDKSGKRGYLSSNRPEGKGQDDIYRFESNYNVLNGLDLDESIKLKQAENVNESDMVKQLVTEPKVVEPADNHSTKVASATKTTQAPKRPIEEIEKPTIETVQKGEEKIREEEKLEPIKKTNEAELESLDINLGDVMILQQVFPDYNSELIEDKAMEKLNSFAMFLNEHRSVKIQISSHSDTKGNESFNQRLTDLRAKRIADFFSANGINSKRFIALGYGGSRPRNHCSAGTDCSEDQHAFNRRIELKIIDK